MANRICAIVFLVIFFLTGSISSITAAERAGSDRLAYPAMVEKFYQIVHQEPFWITSAAVAPLVRAHFIKELDSAGYFGLDKEKYHYAQIASEIMPGDSAATIALDRAYTDAAIAFCMDIYKGAGIKNWLRNDEVSAKYEAADDNYILSQLSTIKLVPNIDVFLYHFEPQTADYRALKEELARQIAEHNNDSVENLKVALNFTRWMHHFHFDKFIVVNIPSNTLHYYVGGNVQLEMKVVVGKPASQTPVMATWCNQVILYPYWYVPSDIAVKELLPKFRKNPAKMDEMGMQMIDAAGNVVDAGSVNWDSLNKENFHYRFRQATGCNNSLGVIKFNLTDPFDVYMHDTNFKEAFESKKNYISHGCIRLENPIDLANALIGEKLDVALVSSCATDQSPIVHRIPKPIPVFVTYQLASTDQANNVIYSPDVYHFVR